MMQKQYECSMCENISCNKQAAEQHNRDKHGGYASIFKARSRNELKSENARLTSERDTIAAAAFEAAAVACDEYPRAAPDYDEWKLYDEQTDHSQRVIRALTPADAKATLDRMLRQAKAEGMREAAEMLDMEDACVDEVVKVWMRNRADTILALTAQPMAQCCMCGKKDLSTAEDGGPECELNDGRWTCSRDCYERATQPVAQEPRTDGPDRIWAWAGDEQDGWENAYATVSHVSKEQVEYIRADRALQSANEAYNRGYEDCLYSAGHMPATPAPVEAGLREAIKAINALPEYVGEQSHVSRGAVLAALRAQKAGKDLAE